MAHFFFMRIAIDLEGGDKSPIPHVEGALAALNTREDLSVLLVGAEHNKKTIEHILRKARTTMRDRIEVRYRPDVVPPRAGKEEVVRSWTRKRTTTMFGAIEAVESGSSDAVLTSGNTGVFAGVAGFQFGRKEKRRPSLLLTLPTPGGTVLVGDVGIDKDPKPEYVVDYAKSAMELAPILIGPKDAYNIATVNIGHEPEKGMPFAIEAAHKLRESGLPWKGHVEPRNMHRGMMLLDEPSNGNDVPTLPLHIALGGGSWMNLWLKTLEATPELQSWSAKEAMKERWWLDPRRAMETVAALITKFGPIRRAKRNMQAKMGAAIVAGLNKFAMKLHGSADAEDVEHAIMVADDVTRSANGH